MNYLSFIFPSGSIIQVQSLVLTAVDEPPALPSVPVVSNVFIGVPPPSLTLINRLLSAEYTEVKDRELAPDTKTSMYAQKTFAPLLALLVEKSCDVMVNVLVPALYAEYGCRVNAPFTLWIRIFPEPGVSVGIVSLTTTEVTVAPIKAPFKEN